MPPSLRNFSNGQPRPHLLYLHVEKTGGSSIECATQGHDLVDLGLFTNMGHTSERAVDQCRNLCTNRGAAPKTVISIREPYSWWRSLYVYGYICSYASTCTSSDFHTFMRQAKPGIAQSNYIRRECGRPCNADYLLRTETLAEDWLGLLRTLGLPLVGLPHANPTGAKSRRETPPTVFTQEIVDIIHSFDSAMFTEFGYPKRTDAPFELT